MLAVGVRIVSALICNLTGFNGLVAPDSAAFAYYGKIWAASWVDPSMGIQGVVGLKSFSFYQLLNGLLVYATGLDPGLILSIVNAFVGTFAAWLTSRLALRLYGSVAARQAFLLAAFLPSVILWTSINLRDAWSFALLMGSLLCAQTLRESFSPGRLVLMIACFAAMPFVRGYLVPVVGLGLASSYLVVRIRRLPVALLSLAGLLICFMVLAEQFGVSLSPDIEERLETLQRLRDGLAYGQSAFDTSIDISTPTGAILYLPFGIANFLLSPFPWRISSWRQIMAMPETLFTYWLVFQAVREMVSSARRRLADLAMMLFVTTSLLFAYSLVEGNEGTAYRHRAHVLLLLAVFAAGDFARRRVLRASGESNSAAGSSMVGVTPQGATL